MRGPAEFLSSVFQGLILREMREHFDDPFARMAINPDSPFAQALRIVNRAQGAVEKERLERAVLLLAQASALSRIRRTKSDGT